MRDVITSHAPAGLILPEWLTATLAADAVGSTDVGGVGAGYVVLPGLLRPLRPDWRVVGRAFTVQASTDDNLAVNHAVTAPPPRGSVLVVGGHLGSRTATVGDLMAQTFRNLGVAAIVTDGMVRDAQALRSLGLPIWCRGTTPLASAKRDAGTVGRGTVIGGVPVRDGDIVIADDDGVVIWPANEVTALVRAATAKRDADDARMARLAADASMRAPAHPNTPHPATGASPRAEEARRERGVERIASRTLTERIARILGATGVPDGDAAIAASHLVEADLRGVHSHGTIRVPTYVRELRGGTTNPRPNVHIAVDNGSQVVVDGDNGLGMVVAHRANDVAIARGLEHGVATVAIRGSNHCGTMAYYTTRAVAHGLIGIATTNAGINMTPTGSGEKLVGNNPLSIAVPSRRPWPLVLDMATSLVAGGKLDVAKARGEAIPLGWARDAAGMPTTDPSLGRAGSLEPVGGPKGYGLAVMLDILAGVLSGGRFGAGLGAPGSAQFLMVLDVRRFMALDQFFERIDALIDQLHGATRLPGVDRIIVAGELEYENQHERERDGVPLDTPVLDALDAVERELGIA